MTNQEIKALCNALCDCQTIQILLADGWSDWDQDHFPNFFDPINQWRIKHPTPESIWISFNFSGDASGISRDKPSLSNINQYGYVEYVLKA